MILWFKTLSLKLIKIYGLSLHNLENLNQNRTCLIHSLTLLKVEKEIKLKSYKYYLVQTNKKIKRLT